jgi:hypothetical protein
MAFSRPPHAPEENWSLYRSPRPDRGDGRHWALVVVLLVSVAIAAITLLLLVRLSSGSTPAGTTGLASQYQQLSDSTLRTCDPNDVDIGRFTTCLLRFEGGLKGLSLPGLKPTVDSLLAASDLARMCVAQPNHDDPRSREWPPECPQRGPASLSSAAMQDAETRRSFYNSMLRDDDAIRQHFQLASPSP